MCFVDKSAVKTHLCVCCPRFGYILPPKNSNLIINVGEQKKIDSFYKPEMNLFSPDKAGALPSTEEAENRIEANL